jgi:hypothetical protein
MEGHETDEPLGGRRLKQQKRQPHAAVTSVRRQAKCEASGQKYSLNIQRLRDFARYSITISL